MSLMKLLSPNYTSGFARTRLFAAPIVDMRSLRIQRNDLKKNAKSQRGKGAKKNYKGWGDRRGKSKTYPIRRVISTSPQSPYPLALDFFTLRPCESLRLCVPSPF